MPDPTVEFFDRVGRCHHDDELVNYTGTIRFDITGDQGTEHWLLTVANGDLELSREVREADLVISIDHVWFDRIVTGRARFYSTHLRNDLRVAGNLQLAGVLVLLAARSSSDHHPRSFVAKGGAGGR